MSFILSAEAKMAMQQKYCSTWKLRKFFDLTVLQETDVDGDQRLSDDWRCGSLLYASDCNMVFANLQAHAALQDAALIVTPIYSVIQLIDMLRCILFRSGDQTEALKALNLRSALFWSSACVVIPFHDQSMCLHFRAVVSDPKHKILFVIDSLRTSSPALDEFVKLLKRCAEQAEWQIEVVQIGHQRDSWSCGLWPIYAALAAAQFVQRSTHAILHISA